MIFLLFIGIFDIALSFRLTNAIPDGFNDVKIADLVLTISLNELKFSICAFYIFVIKEKSGCTKSHKVLISPG